MNIRKFITLTVVACLLLIPGGYAEMKVYAQNAVWDAKQTKVCCGETGCTLKNNQTMVFELSELSAGVLRNSAADEVVRMVNEERAKYGLRPLTVSAQLNAAAAVRAREIAERFSHTRPDGTSWSTVSSLAKGENIARGHRSAQRVMAAWMTSEGHRRNILRESFGSIGVSALNVNGVIYWVQLFGR